MAIASYSNPTTRRLGGTFYNSAGVATNAAGAVRMTVKDPAGTQTVYTFALAQLTNDTAGHYYRDILLNQSGQWAYLIEADMDNNASLDTGDGTLINVEPRVL